MGDQNNKNERRILNRLNDAFFKNLFGRPGHEKYLISLLNSMFESFHQGRRIVIQTLSYLNREIDPITDNGKACRMDLMAQIDDGSIIDIEIQLLNSSSSTIRKRTLYYFSKLYERGIKSGDDYVNLRPCIMVNIVNFKLDEDEEFLSRYQLRKYNHDRILNDDIDFFFIELPKWRKISTENSSKSIKEINRLNRWLTYLTGSDPKLIAELKENDPLIKEAIMFEKKYTMDDASWYEYLMREKAYLDQNSLENWAKREIAEGRAKGHAEGRAEGHAEGLAEGRAEGLAEGLAKGAQKTLLQNIKGLLKFGLDEKTIKKGLNCTDEQIQEAKSLP